DRHGPARAGRLRFRHTAAGQGGSMSTLVIAEAGVNHNGDPAMARRLIEAAARAGADLVKFQTFDAQRLATAQALKAQYQARTTDAAESQRSMLKRLELPQELH